MLDSKYIRNSPDLVRETLANRHSLLDLDEFLALDQKWRDMLLHVEKMKEERNAASTEVGKRKKTGQNTACSLMRG